MEQRRFLLFLTLSMVILIGWMNVGPILFPAWFPKPPKPPVKRVDEPTERTGSTRAKGDQPAKGEATAASEEAAASKTAEQPAADPTVAEAAPSEKPDAHPPEKKLTLPDHPVRSITLGSEDPASGYFLKVRLTSVGASILDVELNDERYTTLEKPKGAAKRPQLKVVSNHLKAADLVAPLQPQLPALTLQTAVPAVDLQLQAVDPRASVNSVSWEIAEIEHDPDDPTINRSVTFRLVSPDGRLELRKKFWLTKVPLKKGQERKIRDTTPDGYQVHFDLAVRNLGQKPASVRYILLGPVGLPLEDADNTRKFRDIKVGFREEDGSIDYEVVHVKEVVGKDEDEIEELKPAPRAFHFIGVDVQYFAALLFPSEEQLGTPDHSYIEFAKPVVVQRDAAHQQWSDISVRLHAFPLTVAPGQEEVHSYTLFAGPKRTELLRPLAADAVLDFSTWFGIGYVSKGLVWLLNLLHSIGIPYGIAILLMTVMVRGAMYPISRKQALGAKKMKELQPQLQEIKKKYAKDKEKLARAQMELFAKHRYNPLAGCLPMLLQFPIFIGLYQSLRMSVDLRLASFLWIDNLAAPDALFPLPFRVPFLGWTEFNLLPILTVVLFLVQQKMFMPPATDEQTEMQQKMMTYMMIFFGFLFYRLPSGLCLYFIASSLWGMGERKLLDYTDTKGPTTENGTKPKPVPGDSKPKKKPGWLARLAEQLDASAQLKKLDGQPAIQKSSRSRKKRKKSRQKR